jgi:ABC-type transporter Mla MlaB component
MLAGMTTKTIPLRGTYAIDRANELAKELGDALSQARVVVVDLSGVEEFDLPAIQILYAAAISAISRGGALRFTGTATETLCGRLVSSGLSMFGPMKGEDFMAFLPNFPKATA